MKFVWAILIIILVQNVCAQQFSLGTSHSSGLYTDEIVVSIDGTFDKVYYTLNGDHPKNGKRYKDSLKINQNTVLRIQPYHNGSRLDTTFLRSYIFNFETNLPIVSIAVPDSSFWSSEYGIYCKGKKAYYDDSSGHWENCNYLKKWEREMHVEYMDTTGKILFNQGAGIRIFGETTRRLSEKSMKIVARGEYGKNRFEGAVFPSKPNITEHKQFVLRTSGNDYRGARFKDCLNAYLIRDLDIDYMAYQPIQLFINGQYWGLYNLREKVNKHYLCYNHNASFDSSSIIMGRWVRQHGSARDYMRMYRFFEDLDTMNDQAYRKVRSMLDIRNYINYRIVQIFLNNSDSRGNIRYWNSKDADGKFRMILYDTDHSHGKYNRKFLEACLSNSRTNWYNPRWSTMYLTKLMEHSQFRADFINQFAHLLNTTLQYDTINRAVDRFVNIYENELPRDRNMLPRYFKNSAVSKENWLKKVDEIRKFAKLRTKHIRGEINRLLTGAGTYELNVEGDSGMVIINDNNPVALPFSGIYFKGVKLSLRIFQDANWKFSSWSDGDTNSTRFVTGDLGDTSISPIIHFIPTKISANDDFNFKDSSHLKVAFSEMNETAIENTSKMPLKYLWEWFAYALITSGFLMILLYYMRRR